MSDVKPKKMVRRSVAIGLGIVCIFVVAGLVGAFAYYVPMINDKDHMISNKDSQIASLESLYDSEVNASTANSIRLNNYINELQAITHLYNSEICVSNLTITQPANSYWSNGIENLVSTNAFYYVGYLSVWVQSSTENTYVRVIWSSYGINFDQQVTVGQNGTANFPLFPMQQMPPFPEIRIGNTDMGSNATETVTITYNY